MMETDVEAGTPAGPDTDPVRQHAAAPRRLSLCADDFGQSIGINRGVLNLLERGRLQATSVLSQGPAWPDGASRLRSWFKAAPPQFDVGLHLNLTHPFRNAEEIRPLSSWLMASWLRRVPQRAVMDSFLRQVDTFHCHLGRLPDYIDGHQHVHAFPVVRETVIHLIDRCWQGHSVRPWLRTPERLTGGDAVLKALVLRASTRGFGALAESQGLRTTPAFGGLYSLRADDGFEGRMKRWLRESPDGTLIMCHPAREDPALPDRNDDIAPARAVEYAYLDSDAFAEDCARSHVLLVRHSDLLAAAQH